ncbi:MAG: hypothetical protein JOY99_05420 [Sphingomonadaceae bacterium]|nr:hypothetical protein [Sphingomonadaceae bacterium]
MTSVKIGLLCGVAALGCAAVPAFAQTAPAETPATNPSAPPASGAASAAPIGDIVVTARRVNERLQDVPVAVSVVTPAVIASKGVFTPVDIAESSPGLSVTASVSDRNNLTYTIRGQGFS